MITVSRILRVVRGFENKKSSIMVALYRFADNEVEAAEFEITSNTLYLGVPLKDLPVKPGVLIAAILHRDKVVIPTGNDTIYPGDRVIIVSHDQSLQEFNDIYEAL
jgi:trk system potassium uptake protein TrkA